MKFIRVAVICCLGVSPVTVYAAETNTTNTHALETLEHQYELDAKHWNLSVEEWTRYQSIMAGEGQYHWPNTDPLTVLGIYAESESDRERYAEMIAKTEFRLQSNFIALNDAYVNAFHRLYGNHPIIALNKVYDQYRQRGLSEAVFPAQQNSDAPRLRIGDRYVLFVEPDCQRCREYYTSLRSQQRPGAALDIYFINTDKAGIMAWAKSMDIEPSLVSGGAITLNLGNEAWAQYERPSLPASYYYNVESGDIVPFSPE